MTGPVKIKKGEAISDWVGTTVGAVCAKAGTIFFPGGWPPCDVAFVVSCDNPKIGQFGDFVPLNGPTGEPVKIRGIAEYASAVPIPPEALAAGFLRIVLVDKEDKSVPAPEDAILRVVVRP